MKKVVLFAFNGDMMCFIHVLLNALDMAERGYETRIVIEGAATKLAPELDKEGNPMYKLFKKVESLGIIEGVCKACSNKMGVLEAVEAQGLRLLGDMSGHPAMGEYMDKGYEIITF